MKAESIQKIFLAYLSYIFIFAYFVNQYLFSSPFNSVIYLIIIPFIFSFNILSLKKHKSLSLIILFHILLFVYYSTDLKSLFNISQIFVGIIFFSSLALLIVKNFKILEIIYKIKKYLQNLLVISLILSTFLTFVKFPNFIDYYFWESLTSEKRLMLMSGGGGGHSSAVFLLPLLLCFYHYEYFKNNKNIKSLFLIIILSILCILTKSRIGYYSVIFVTLSSLLYLNFNFFRKFYSLLIILIGCFFVISSSLSNKYVNNHNNFFLDFIISTDKTRKNINTPNEFFSGRNILNNYLISEIEKKPFFGSGHNTPLQNYGLDKEGFIAFYRDEKSVGRESPLMLAFKYGIPYFLTFILFIFTIPLKIKGISLKHESFLFQNIWMVCFLIIISGGGFTVMHSSSGFIFLMLSILYFIPKYEKIS